MAETFSLFEIDDRFEQYVIVGLYGGEGRNVVRGKLLPPTPNPDELTPSSTRQTTA